MALKNTTSPEDAARGLSAAITARVAGATDVKVSDVRVPASSGLSNETILFDASWEASGGRHQAQLVARVQPTGPAVFPRYDFALESLVMGALAERSPVPVPEILFHEDDPSVLGAPFIVMSRVDGRVPSDDPPHTVSGWVTDLTDTERATLIDNGLATLACLHDVDIDAIDLAELRDHPESGLDGQLSFWRELFDWAREGESNPTVEAAFQWLSENRPASPGDDVLVWGDARIGNLLFGDDLRVSAVLDWEMVAVAPAGVDIGWWLFMQRYYSEGIGVPLIAGFPTAEQTLARYEELTGRRIEDLHYYEVLAATRLAALLHRAGKLMIAGGMLPPDATMALNNPASQLLANLLGLPSPEGDAQSFVGNRS